jgi:hypothetical protein
MAKYRVTHRYYCTADVVVEAESLGEARMAAEALRPASWQPISPSYLGISQHPYAVEVHPLIQLESVVDPERRDQARQMGAGYE